MSIGIWQIVVIAIVVVVLFGRGKISDLMGDVAKGITSFRKGIAEGNEEMKATAASPDEKEAQKADATTIDNETGEPINDKKS